MELDDRLDLLDRRHQTIKEAFFVNSAERKKAQSFRMTWNIIALLFLNVGSCINRLIHNTIHARLRSLMATVSSAPSPVDSYLRGYQYCKLQ